LCHAKHLALQPKLKFIPSSPLNIALFRHSHVYIANTMMTSATNKPDPTKPPTARPTAAKPPRTGAESIEETITVVDGPPQVEKDVDDASCFARRTVIPRIPPQAKAHPAPLRGAPGAPKRNQGRAITPFDAEDEELSDYEEEGNPFGSDITLVAPKSPTQTLGEAIELLRKMRP
jgi:hypothetical protein